MNDVQLPVAALTVIGILLVVLGLLVAGNFTLVAVGLVSIGFAGILGLFASRRT